MAIKEKELWPTALKDVMAFMIEGYPKESAEDLSNARLTRMVDLADWHFAIKYKQQITNIRWYFDTYGPFVKNIEQTVTENSALFVTDLGYNQNDMPKTTYSLRGPSQKTEIGENEGKSLTHIIKITYDLYWGDFMDLVYSTYPVSISERYSYLNLPQRAAEYRKLEMQEA